MRESWGPLPFILIAIVLLVAIPVIVVNTTVETYAGCVVTDKDRTTKPKGGSDMRIYTENCGTFVVEDNMFYGQFNSADEYSRIKVGSKYDFRAVGVRIPIFSMFPNIIESEEAL